MVQIMSLEAWSEDVTSFLKDSRGLFTRFWPRANDCVDGRMLAGTRNTFCSRVSNWDVSLIGDYLYDRSLGSSTVCLFSSEFYWT